MSVGGGERSRVKRGMMGRARTALLARASDPALGLGAPRTSSEAEPYAGREWSLMCEGMGCHTLKDGQILFIGWL